MPEKHWQERESAEIFQRRQYESEGETALSLQTVADPRRGRSDGMSEHGTEAGRNTILLGDGFVEYSGGTGDRASRSPAIPNFTGGQRCSKYAAVRGIPALAQTLHSWIHPSEDLSQWKRTLFHCSSGV